MTAAAEYDRIVLDAAHNVVLACWHAYDAVSRVELHSTALRVGDRLFLIDPIPLAKDAWGELLADAIPAAIILTNANHPRAAGEYRRRLAIPVHARAGVFEELDEVIPAAGGPVLGELEALPLAGAAPGEVALYYGGAGGLLIVGDALIDLPGHGFAFLPAKYCTDPRQMRRSLRSLLDRPFAVLAMAHGQPIVAGAHARLAALLAGETAS